MAVENGCGLCSVQMKGIGVQKGRDSLLEDVSFEMHCGELTALIGVNGAGKTTLLRAILGEIRHTGTVHYHSHDGKDLSEITVGYVPQHLDFDRSAPVSVMDFLLAGRTQAPVWLTRPRALQKEVRQRLAGAGCEGLEGRPLGALSGGELQRVMLAQALYPTPELLILDEPVSGVDTVGSEQFYEKISQLRHDYHMAILMVSHDLELVHLHADKAVLLNKKVLCAGEIDAVYNSRAFREAFGTGGAVK